ncbi:hypothetical protein KJZ71_04670 [Patescibacteria group bacterium]|uniref:DNA polymerase III subunit delta n=1 Tax=candidate division WWE3 bacterium TaxID=2053526 RepID=A0A928TRU2_UNCKA|nr:hypothetical protein [candidate division WWE3 bacterium]MCL4733062.1 hypothetical protein [Patescibacteria group bacterium]MDL1953317.1 hypothetical protein [Candidatus Uhrbacteria bacterium UHB]RIL00546.1 MAG: hypothetical protein DCC77_03240 [Candidatus Uhrbacteria bacterium]
MPTNDIFQDIFGHEAAKTLLRRALIRPGQAYCILGPKGVGRHLVAERFVRGLAGLPGDRPFSGHPDIAILERQPSESGKMRAQISVESVRHLRVRMAQRPVLAERIVAYVPEADTLNEEGVNALLKCLEEPRAGAVFVCVVSQEARLPDTFWSRVHRLRLSPLSHEDMMKFARAHHEVPDLLQEALFFAEGRPGHAARYLQDAGLREAIRQADKAVDACLTAASAGGAFAAIREQADRAESNDDAVQAWRETLHLWCRSLRRHLRGTESERVIHLGNILLVAERALGGPVSPRVFIELGLVRLTEGKLSPFPELLASPYPYPLDL